MNKLIPTLIAGALGMTAFASVQAQEAPAPSATDTVATLQVKQGSVMHSIGGEFESANSGMRLIDGERIMVSEGAKVVIVYDDKCREEFGDPGVYNVENHGCREGYVSNAGVASAVAVGAVLAPLLVDGGDQDLTPPPAPPPPPVSQ